MPTLPDKQLSPGLMGAAPKVLDLGRIDFGKRSAQPSEAGSGLDGEAWAPECIYLALWTPCSLGRDEAGGSPERALLNHLRMVSLSCPV